MISSLTIPHFFCRMIYKCVMCDTVFTQKPLLYVHFDTHLAKQKVHVFKCPDCTKLYAQKGSMMEHIKVCFPVRHSHRHQISSLPLCVARPLAFHSAHGVKKGIQQALVSALARSLLRGLVLSSISSTLGRLPTECDCLHCWFLC